MARIRPADSERMDLKKKTKKYVKTIYFVVNLNDSTGTEGITPAYNNEYRERHTRRETETEDREIK